MTDSRWSEACYADDGLPSFTFPESVKDGGVLVSGWCRCDGCGCIGRDQCMKVYFWRNEAEEDWTDYLCQSCYEQRA